MLMLFHGLCISMYFHVFRPRNSTWFIWPTIVVIVMRCTSSPKLELISSWDSSGVKLVSTLPSPASPATSPPAEKRQTPDRCSPHGRRQIHETSAVCLLMVSCIETMIDLFFMGFCTVPCSFLGHKSPEIKKSSHDREITASPPCNMAVKFSSRAQKYPMQEDWKPPTWKDQLNPKTKRANTKTKTPCWQSRIWGLQIPQIYNPISLPTLEADP